MRQNFKKYSLLGVLLLNVNFLYANNDVVIKMPNVPEVPKVEAIVPKVIIVDGTSGKENSEILKEFTKKKVVVFSDHVAPQIAEKKNDTNKTVEIGDIQNGRVAAYLHAPYIDLKTTQEKLQNAGFTILATYKIDKKGLANSIVFTNSEMEKHAAKDNRAFAGSLRVTVDKKNQLLSIANPIYHMKAFMQGQYDSALAENTLKSIRENFKGLQNSTEIMKFLMLERFQFMEGMPKYNDMIDIKEATQKELLAKVKNHKNTLFIHTLSNGSTLVGVKLSKRTTKFIKKTGYTNAGLLPYPVLIENGKVKILDPKYYIAVMYPMLKMSQFMTISTIPGAITKEIDKMFR